MEQVSFYSEGYKLSGYVRIPRTYNRKIPGIVCCHGYSAMIELYMQDIAERLSEAGYATLIFHHRGLGESEGPRFRVIPQEQAEDVRNAVTYLQTRTEVDTDKIGLYGTSLGGANVVYAAAVDTRVKCVVSTGGIGDCERWLKSIRRPWEWLQFRKQIEEDRTNRVLTGRSRYVDPHEILPLDPDAFKYLGEAVKSFGQKYESKGYPLETADRLLCYKPELVIDRISPRATLIIHVANDVVVPSEEAYSMYQKAKEPKKIVIIEADAHHDVYKFRNPAVFDKVMTTAIDWYKEYLPTK